MCLVQVLGLCEPLWKMACMPQHNRRDATDMHAGQACVYQDISSSWL
jgi:hypothetical protein